MTGSRSDCRSSAAPLTRRRYCAPPAYWRRPRNSVVCRALLRGAFDARSAMFMHLTQIVMAGLDPAIHVDARHKSLSSGRANARTRGPGMTKSPQMAALIEGRTGVWETVIGL